MQSKATWNALSNNERLSAFNDKRQFVMTRSSFSGSGKYASHYTGDNYRTYDDLKFSIASLMNFNMFGIPHVGADVCGYFDCKPGEKCLSLEER